MSPPRLMLAAWFMLASFAEVRCDPSLSCGSTVIPPIPEGAVIIEPRELDCDGGACEAVAVAAGGDHSCAVVADEAGPLALCWGDGHHGQLGRRARDSSHVPQALAYLRAMDVFAGELLSCARFESSLTGGDFRMCFGTNARGVLGPSPDASGGGLSIPEGVDFGRLSVGALHTVGGTGTLRIVGDLSQQQGGARTGELTTFPIELHMAEPILMGSAGGLSTCVVQQRGAVACAGRHGLDAPIRIRGDFKIVAPLLDGFWSVDVGLAHGCAIHESLELWCFGRGHRGELGRGAFGDDDIGGGLVELENVIAVSCGGAYDVTVHSTLEYSLEDPGRAHTCAVSLDGALHCWGANESGQLGDGTLEDRASPVRVPLPGRAERVDTGDAHSCAVVEQDVYCWGSNDHGQLGLPAVALPRSPIPLRVAF